MYPLAVSLPLVLFLRKSMVFFREKIHHGIQPETQPQELYNITEPL